MDREAARKILRENVGFDDPDRWVEFAIRHRFEPVRANRIRGCPDCGAPPSTLIGQFVYYSTLCRLACCPACGLVYSDVHLDQAVIESHFAVAYKEEEYFSARRRPVFEHLCGLIDRVTPPGGAVLDIGGAKGHLMNMLRTRRPDIAMTVSDLSADACAHAREVFGFSTIQGDVRVLGDQQKRWDVVVLSDVLYYEPRISQFWDQLRRILRAGGAVVIRVPNKLGLLVLGQILWRATHRLRDREMQSSLRFFNPEHSFVFPRKYLARRLTSVGCSQVVVHPSPPLGAALPDSTLGSWQSLGRALGYRLARGIASVSGGRFILTPGMVVVGTGFRGPTS